LAEGIISIPYLSLIENEKAQPRPDILNPLARRLHTTMQNLMGVTDEETIKEAENLIDKVQTALIYEGVEQALENLEALKSLSSSVADSKVLMKIDLMEINLWVHQFDEVRYLPKLKEFEERWDQFQDDPNVLVWYLRIKGNIEFQKDQYEKALIHYKAAEKILPEVTDELEKGYIYGNLGKVYLLLGNPPLGILYAEKAIQVMLRQDRWVEMCAMLNILGSCHTYNGDYIEGIQCFERVLRMANQLTISPVFISRAYHNLGVCHMKLEAFDRATYFLNLSLEVVDKDKLADWEIGCVHQALCQTYLKMNDLDKARQHIDAAIELLKKRERMMAECLIYLGQIHYAQGEFDEFQACYTKAIRSFQSLEIYEKVARTSHTLGKYLFEKGEIEEANRYLLLAAENYNNMFPSVDFDVNLPKAKEITKALEQGSSSSVIGKPN
jgi:HTH-type transcriptional regulator, quorum sensing regulator NprR